MKQTASDSESPENTAGGEVRHVDGPEDGSAKHHWGGKCETATTAAEDHIGSARQGGLRRPDK